MRKLAALLLLSTAMHASVGRCADEREAKQLRQRKLAQIIDDVTGPTTYQPGMSGDETEVDLRYYGFSPIKQDEPQLLAAFRDKHNDLVSRLCLAAYLAQLENEAARKFLLECLDGKHVEKPVDEAGDVPTLRVSLDSPEKLKRNAAYAVKFAAGSSTRLNWAVRQMMKIVENEVLPAHNRAFLDICTRLGRIKSMEVAQILMEVVRRHPNAYEPALALGQIGDMRAERILLDTIESRGRLARAQSFALYMLKSKKLVPILVRHLEDDAAISILVEWKDQRAVEPLKKFIANGHDRTGKARLALARIESKNNAELATRLIELLKDKSIGDIRWQIIEPLGATRDPRGIEPLVAVGTTCGDDLEWSQVVDALQMIGGEKAIAALRRLLERDFSTLVIDGKPPYRKPQKEALDAIKRLTDKKAE